MNRKTYEEQEAEHFAEMAREFAWMDLGTFGDASGILDCLRSGNIDKNVLVAAANLIEELTGTPEYRAKVARARQKAARVEEVYEAFRLREFDWLGDPIKNPRSAEDVALELAERFGFTDTRQVYAILKSTGYRSVKRGGTPPARFEVECDDFEDGGKD